MPPQNPLPLDQNSKAGDIDPNRVQRRAANPKSSVWVGASAGTGKTKVLTDRLLRLMLPHEDGIPATPPHRILCLTFTKIAAAEMKERFTDKLRKWSVMSEPELNKELQKLFGHSPTPEQLIAAQSLFAKVVDTPGGLKIMTIHSFCQSILGRFPLEAGLSPNMEVIEETDQAHMLDKAFSFILDTFQQNDSEKDETSQAGADILNRLLRYQNDSDLRGLCRQALSERKQFEECFREYGDLEGIEKALFALCDVEAEETKERMLAKFRADFFAQKSQLEALYSALLDSKIKDNAKADKLQLCLQNPNFSFEDVYDVFFSPSTGNIYSPSKTVQQNHEALVTFFTDMAETIARLQEKMRSYDTARLSCDLIFMAKAVLAVYDGLKARENVLDFDDLIHYTAQLLDNARDQTASAWVMYKLDGGINHILVDEAQDTNPEQWAIIEGLTAEFFAGEAREEISERTVFVVGDEKQSIFSFQRADPQSFFKMREFFAAKITEAGKLWDPVQMNISFRTTQGILNHVDQVFADLKTQHISYRGGQAAHIEIWPLFSDKKEQSLPSWTPPVNILQSQKAGPALAAKIAQTIRGWLDERRLLPSRGRPIRPGDIMILVRSRNPFVTPLIRALKAENIPVNGADRMIIKDELVVNDLLACIDFALLPDDDLTLAGLLKSPFIGMDEEGVFALCHGRKGNLWQSLRSSNHDHVIGWCESLMKQAALDTPFAFLNHILYQPCPASKRSGIQALIQRLGQDCLDAIEELLQRAQKFEQDETGHLQNFVHDIKAQDSAIKRELDLSGDVVQIITAHGAKGLQAPIIFMPDTTRSWQQARGKSAKLLWPKDTQLPLPLWAPYKEVQSSLYLNAAEMISKKDEAEYRRLLYVAMTRAEDELYICGINKKGSENNWYADMFEALGSLPESQKQPFDAPDNIDISDDQKIIYHIDQEKEADKADDDTVMTEAQEHILPDWIGHQAPEEPSPPRPLSPSRPSESEPAALSPLQKENEYRFKRGNITHALLQFLPDIPETERKESAQKWLSQPGHDLSPAIQESILDEVIAIVNNPSLSPLFGRGSQAETPVTGVMDGKVLSGQIDRLLITDQEIRIIDYKSNRPSPDNVENVPSLYKRQLEAYAKALESIYPGRQVKKYILWTDSAILMELL